MQLFTRLDTTPAEPVFFFKLKYNLPSIHFFPAFNISFFRVAQQIFFLIFKQKESSSFRLLLLQPTRQPVLQAIIFGFFWPTRQPVLCESAPRVFAFDYP